MSADYEAPESLQPACDRLAELGPQARVLAGGTDLIVQMRSGRLAPEHVIDLKRLPGLLGISQDEQGFLIGAATPCVQIGRHGALRAAWPGVVEAATLIGSAQVQGRASLGGNLCNASPAADSVPALIAAQAQCLITGPQGERTLPVSQIQAGPGRNHLAPGEIVRAIRLGHAASGSADAYLRLIPRTEMDIAVVGVAVWVQRSPDGQSIADLRLALGAVAPTALEVAVPGLKGQPLDDTVLAAIDQAARAACRPIDDKRGTAAYRTRVAGVLARRAAIVAWQRSQGVSA
jgi:CO/xanthine dehydrogenase FAD-binding subunit